MVPQPVTTPSPGMIGLFHAEIHRAVGDEHVVFFEGAGIEQHIEALAGRQLALGVLGVDALLAAAQAGRVAARLKRFDDLLHRTPNLPVLLTV